MQNANVSVDRRVSDDILPMYKNKQSPYCRPGVGNMILIRNWTTNQRKTTPTKHPRQRPGQTYTVRLDMIVASPRTG